MGHKLIATFDSMIDQLTFDQLLLQIEDRCSPMLLLPGWKSNILNAKLPTTRAHHSQLVVLVLHNKINQVPVQTTDKVEEHKCIFQ
jgi:hypothetical protein